MEYYGELSVIISIVGCITQPQNISRLRINRKGAPRYQTQLIRLVTVFCCLADIFIIQQVVIGALFQEVRGRFAEKRHGQAGIVIICAISEAGVVLHHY